MFSDQLPTKNFYKRKLNVKLDQKHVFWNQKNSVDFVKKLFLGLMLDYCLKPTRHLLVQSEKWKQWNNVLKLFKINNKDIRTTLLTLNK